MTNFRDTIVDNFLLPKNISLCSLMVMLGLDRNIDLNEIKDMIEVENEKGIKNTALKLSEIIGGNAEYFIKIATEKTNTKQEK